MRASCACLLVLSPFLADAEEGLPSEPITFEEILPEKEGEGSVRLTLDSAPEEALGGTAGLFLGLPREFGIDVVLPIGADDLALGLKRLLARPWQSLAIAGGVELRASANSAVGPAGEARLGVAWEAERVGLQGAVGWSQALARGSVGGPEGAASLLLRLHPRVGLFVEGLVEAPWRTDVESQAGVGVRWTLGGAAFTAAVSFQIEERSHGVVLQVQHEF